MTEWLLTEMNTHSTPQKDSTVFILLSVRGDPKAKRTKRVWHLIEPTVEEVE